MGELIITKKPTFLFELGDMVRQNDEKIIADVVELTVVGRVQWKEFENDYIVCPVGLEYDKETWGQVAESKLRKVK